MINLLPSEEIKEMAAERLKKLIVVFGLSFLIVSLSFLLSLLSVRFYIVGEVQSQKSDLAAEEKERMPDDFLFVKSSIEAWNKKLAAVDAFYKKSAPLSEAFGIVLSLPRTNGIRFTNISAKRIKEKKGTEVIVSGISESRDDLLVFKKVAERDARITSVDFSMGSWVRSQDLNFQAVFEIK